MASLPPAIGVGLKSERSVWVQVSAAEARSRMWNPAEFHHFATRALQLDDPELLRACELLNQEASKRADDRSIQRVLLDVASALNTYRWAEVLPITGDFVVFAVAEDDDLPQIRRGIKTAAPASVYAQLRTRNWVCTLCAQRGLSLQGTEGRLFSGCGAGFKFLPFFSFRAALRPEVKR